MRINHTLEFIKPILVLLLLVTVIFHALLCIDCPTIIEDSKGTYAFLTTAANMLFWALLSLTCGFTKSKAYIIYFSIYIALFLITPNILSLFLPQLSLSAQALYIILSIPTIMQLNTLFHNDRSFIIAGQVIYSSIFVAVNWLLYFLARKIKSNTDKDFKGSI